MLGTDNSKHSIMEWLADKGNASYDQLLQRAIPSKEPNTEGYRTEFIRLAEKAQLLDAAKSE